MKALSLLGVLFTYPLVRNVWAADANVADYEKLCAVYNLAASVAKFPEDKKEDKAGSILSEINFLNISVADQAFYDSGNLSRTEEEKSSPSSSTEGWQAKRERLSEKIASTGKERIKGRVQDSVFRSLAASQINSILREAEKRVERYETSRLKVENALSAAKQACEKAIFGKGSPKWGDSETLDVATFTDTAGENRWASVTLGSGKGCGNNGNEKTGISIISDLSCLCLGRESSGNTYGKESCGKSISVSSADFSTTAAALADPATGWGVIKKHCEKGTSFTSIPSQHDLEKALQGYLRRIGIKEANKVGGGSGTTCTGGASNQICVIYTQVLSGGDVTKIPWVAEVLTAASKVGEYNQGEQEAAKQLQILEALNTTAWAVFKGVAGVEVSETGGASRLNQTVHTLEAVQNHHQKASGADNHIKTTEGGEPHHPDCLPRFIGFLALLFMI